MKRLLGTPLMIVESMKMENTLVIMSGKVSNIFISIDDSVQYDQSIKIE